MDRSTRRMDEGTIPAAPPSGDYFPFDPLSPKIPGLDAGSTRPVDRSLGTHNLPMGTQERNPSSPFPPETGKRTLETGPSYER